MGIKISELPQATYPLESDIFPIVQEGETKQINANLFNSQVNNNIANEFSSTSTYQVGNYVFYQGVLYCCTEAVMTAGEWNANNWELVQLADKVGLGGESLPVGVEVDYDGTSVPTGWEEVDPVPTYSTEETVCGTWIDGKPLYRKYIEVTGGNSFSYTVTDMEELISIYGYCYISGQTQYHRAFPHTQSGANLHTTYYQNGVIYFEGDRTDNKVFLTIEYTKTTD